MEIITLSLVLAVMILPIFGYLAMLDEKYFETKKLGKKTKIYFALEVGSLALLTVICLI
jgi:hypothetical protein